MSLFCFNFLACETRFKTISEPEESTRSFIFLATREVRRVEVVLLRVMEREV